MYVCYFEHNESKYFVFLFVCVCLFLLVSEKCYLLSGRSVLSKIVPEVLTTGTLGRVYSFSQYRPTLVGELQFFRILYEMFSKIPFCVRAVITARSSMN